MRRGDRRVGRPRLRKAGVAEEVARLGFRGHRRADHMTHGLDRSPKSGPLNGFERTTGARKIPCLAHAHGTAGNDPIRSARAFQQLAYHDPPRSHAPSTSVPRQEQWTIRVSPLRKHTIQPRHRGWREDSIEVADSAGRRSKSKLPASIRHTTQVRSPRWIHLPYSALAVPQNRVLARKAVIKHKQNRDRTDLVFLCQVNQRQTGLDLIPAYRSSRCRFLNPSAHHVVPPMDSPQDSRCLRIWPTNCCQELSHRAGTNRNRG